MVEYKNLPPALLRDGLFCVWKYENREGKPTKVPYNPRTGGRAQSTNPATFAPLDTALAVLGQYDGLGVGIFGHVARSTLTTALTTALTTTVNCPRWPLM